jgi:hypothetical protein
MIMRVTKQTSRSDAHDRGVRRRALYSVALLAAAATGVGTILVVHSDRRQPLSEKLGALIVDEAVNHSCVGGRARIQRVTAEQASDLYHDLLPRARFAEIVACDDTGAVSIVVHFNDRASLVRAFRHSKNARDSGWCFVGSSAFDGGLLDHPSSLSRFCTRLHGKLRWGPYELSRTGS